MFVLLSKRIIVSSQHIKLFAINLLCLKLPFKCQFFNLSLYIATFQVQELKLDFMSSTYHLNIMCVNALEVNKSCEIEVLDETKGNICKFNANPREEVSCALPKRPAVVILVMAYDEGYPDVPAVTETFITPDSKSPMNIPELDSDSYTKG